MSRVVITGLGCISAAGLGTAALAAALQAGQPLGRIESVETVRGRRRAMRLARIGDYEKDPFLPASKLRRMGPASQAWTVACLLAHADAGLGSTRSPTGACPPERRGVLLGTGFGCIETTWEFLKGLCRDGAGMASPFLFSESVASAATGHGAIELDARGASATFTCGDASAAAALAAGAAAIRNGRLIQAYCGGVELLSPPLLRVLAGIGAPEFLGEGCACLVLESLESARARGARIYAELAGSAAASDPDCAPTDWSTDDRLLARAMGRAVEQCGSARVAKVFLHGCGPPAADQAERRAARSVCPSAELVRTTEVFGSLAAAGGVNLASAVLDTARLSSRQAALVTASSWGGSLFSIGMTSVTEH